MSVLCILSWLPFCPGLPGAMCSGTIPSRIHQMASLERPLIATEAKGVPLSVRMIFGKPYFRNVATQTAFAGSVAVVSSAWQPSTYLHKSV